MVSSSRDHSKEFMESPDKWPRWPQLPLVNRKTDKSGFIIEGSTSVFLGNIWDDLDFHTMESIIYSSIEEIVDAGWEVD